MVTVTAKRILGTQDFDNHFLLVSGNLVTKYTLRQRIFQDAVQNF